MLLSLCMIVKNEENTLGRCLESVKDIVDEMIIVDTGSTDNTIKIAEEYGAKIYFYKWDDSFSNARNYSLSKATKDWILIMDADDEIRSEDKDTLIKLINNETNQLNAYFGETLSYSGDVEDYNIHSNLNIRLIRNHKGYKFVGDIHEQIIPCTEDKNKKFIFGVANIKFYHYGYLSETINNKNKRERNMNIIKEILEKDPDNTFMLYNMGVEYSAQGDYSESLKYLEKAYKNFNTAFGFGPKLILKMISCNEMLQNFDKCLELIDEGLKIYPDCTDYEFYRANILYRQKEFFSAIKSAKKCISMGEPPILLRYISGVSTYRPYYLLGIIYSTIGDYDEAYKYYDKALRLNPKLTDAVFKLSEVMAIKKMSTNEIQKNLESYFDNITQETNLLLSKVFYIQNQFDLAYKYAEKAETSSGNLTNVYFYKGLYLFYLQNYKDALKNLSKIKADKHYNNAIYCSILCELFIENYEKVDELLKITEDFNKPEETMVYKNFISIIKEDKYIRLADDNENSKKFIKPIFNLLEVLLRANCFNQFKKAVNLLNLINDNTIFMLLGKLYYKYGYFSFAYKEFIRSIKIHEVIDADALNMMRTILLSNES